MPRTSISSNHFSHDQQLVDAINYLKANDPKLYEEFLFNYGALEHPILEGSELVGLPDEEYSSWASDWLEDNTPISWEDGEPWWIDKNECWICEEKFSANDLLNGNMAEMHDPANPEEGGLVHAECGVAKGWEIS